MSTQKSSKIKFIFSMIAMTSIAALNPAVNAQTPQPGAVDNLLNRANLSTDSIKVRPGVVNNVTPSVQKLPGTIKPGGENAHNFGCVNAGCAERLPNNGRRIINPTILNEQIRK
jgi:hypothetical protein